MAPDGLKGIKDVEFGAKGAESGREEQGELAALPMRACTLVRRVRRVPEGLSGSKGRPKSGFILSRLDSKGSEWP
jgi:hypothetical protein